VPAPPYGTCSCKPWACPSRSESTLVRNDLTFTRCIGLSIHSLTLHMPFGSSSISVFLQGPFSRNDQFVISPFNDKLFYFFVPYPVGSQILNALNAPTSGGSKRSWSLTFAAYEDPEEYARGNVDARFNRWRRVQWEPAQRHQSDNSHKRNVGEALAIHATTMTTRS
jgi:NAD nucleotidase, C-terminal domain